MLRDKGAPALTPFPGEQGFESADMDLDQFGTVLQSGSGLSATQKKKKKKPVAPPKKDYKEGRTKEEIESSLEFVPSDETVQIGGVN